MALAKLVAPRAMPASSNSVSRFIKAWLGEGPGTAIDFCKQQDVWSSSTASDCSSRRSRCFVPEIASKVGCKANLPRSSATILETQRCYSPRKRTKFFLYLKEDFLNDIGCVSFPLHLSMDLALSQHLEVGSVIKEQRAERGSVTTNCRLQEFIVSYIHCFPRILGRDTKLKLQSGCN